MVFAVAGGGQLDTGGYQIDNSLRFNKADTPRLVRTPSASNRKTFTLSCWVKRSAVRVSYEQSLYEVRPSAGTYFGVSFRNTGSPAPDELFIFSSAGSFNISLQGVFRDVSAWYHIVLAFDTTQATSSNRIKMYVNGNQVSTGYYNTYPAQNTDLIWNTNNEHTIGGSGFVPSDESSNFYLSEIHHIDGQQLDASSFGEFDDSGIWKPKQYSGSYGTNGFYLDFENSGSLGADQSGNGNNFTPTNLASTDQMPDTPTNNFATGNPLMTNYWIRTVSQATGSQGNLEWISTGADNKAGATMSTAGGKWYAEMRVNSLGFVSALVSGYDANEFEIGYNQAGNRQFNRATPVSYGASFGAGDVIGIAVDQDNNQVTFYKNGASQGTLTNTFVGDTFFIGAYVGSANITFNFGQDSTFAGRETAASNTDGNGYGEFHHSVPSGYLALCSQNLATELSPAIDDGSAYFQAKIYTGDGTEDRNITNDGNSDLQPDLIWFKSRSTTDRHALLDSTRGATKNLSSNTTGAEDTNNGMTAFQSNGFQVGGQDEGVSITNWNGFTYVAWQWKANGGTTSSNTDGSITSTVQANPTAGFSIVTYSGNQTNGATVGHGLGIAPQVVIIKERNGTSSWIVKHPGLTDAGYYLILNATDGESTAANVWNDTDPSSTVFTLGNNTSVNENTLNYVAYCFAEISGYSKVGKYTGNGSTDGSFIYTGFKPAFVLLKDTASGNNWNISDNARNPINPSTASDWKRLLPDESTVEQSGATGGYLIDFVSNGFKQRGSGAEVNGNGKTYIYMAFAENPLVTSTGVPITAR